LAFGSRYKAVMAASLTTVLLLSIAPSRLLAGTTDGAAGEKDADSRFNLFIDEPERKDPFVAGLLSWAWPGLGQFYAQDYATGSLFLFADLAMKGLLVFMLFHYSDKYHSGSGDVVRLQDMEEKDKGIIVGYIFSMLFLKVACVVDAVTTADRYNRDIYFPYWKSQKKLNLSFQMQRDGVMMAVSTHF
jgi:hypothetical protein